jgi:hypothetical protein
LGVVASVIRDAILHFKSDEDSLYYYGLLIESLYLENGSEWNFVYESYINKNEGEDINYVDLALYFIEN